MTEYVCNNCGITINEYRHKHCKKLCSVCWDNIFSRNSLLGSPYFFYDTNE